MAKRSSQREARFIKPYNEDMKNNSTQGKQKNTTVDGLPPRKRYKLLDKLICFDMFKPSGLKKNN